MVSKSTRLYHRRRGAFIAARGGRCESCGSIEQLEIDHIDPAKKTMAAGDAFMRRAEIRETELAKCQVLCSDCHLAKTIAYVQENLQPAPCSIRGCSRRREGRGLCGTHLSRAGRGRPIDAPIRAYKKQSGSCSVAGCDEDAKCKQMCKRHYDRDLWRRKHSVAA